MLSWFKEGFKKGKRDIEFEDTISCKCARQLPLQGFVLVRG